MNTQIADIRYFYHADHLGSSSMLTDEWGDVYQTLSYMPFGEVLVDLRQDEDIFTPYQFNAKELDEETGLNYYVARYYNSLFSFFITSDPHRERYPYISSYAYCLNNPVKFIDPDGKKVFFAKGVSKDFKNHFTTAVKHLNKRGVGKMLNELEKSEKIYYITELIGEGSSYNTKINTISWNPTSGIFTNEGHELLPTTVLNHEIDHALEHDKNPE